MYDYGDFNINTILRKITTNKSITYCEKTFQLLSAGNRNAQEIKIKIIIIRRIFIHTRSIPRKNTTYNSNDNRSIYTYYEA